MEHSAEELAGLQGEPRLTELELASVQQLLDGEILGLKKCQTYMEFSQDEQVRQLLAEQADIRHRRIDMMLALLEGEGDVTKRAKLLLQGQQGEEYGHD